MEFTCERGDLFEVLGNVQTAIPSRSTHPVLSNVLLVAGPEGIKITGTDLDVSITGGVEGNSIEEGAFALPAKRTFDLLRELGPGEVYFKREGSRVSIEQGAGKFTVSGVEKEEYPAEEILKEKEAEFEVDADELSRLLSKTSFAVSADVARIALSGLYIKFSGEKMIAVATDGHRLTLISRETNSAGDEIEMLIPAKTVGHLSKMLGEAAETVKIEIGKGTARFIVDGYTLSSKLITEKFPDYEQVIPRDNTKTLIVDRGVLMQAVKRASVLSNPMTHLVKFDVTEGKTELSCSDYDVGGEAHDEIPVEYSDDPLPIGFNSNYLLEVLRHIESDEVKLLMKNPLSAALIYPLPQEESEEYLSILMPLRLPEEEG